MAVELGASRLLAPYFSSSQIVWTIIIGTIMIAMALGNFWGGRSADRNPDPDRLYRRILLAAVWIAAIPVVGKYVIVGISGLLVLTISSNFLIIAAFLSCLLLFVFPLFLLGTVTPSLVKYTIHSLDDSGAAAGTLGAFNTVGSVIGTFIPTFVTIPAIGTSVTFLLFSGLLLAVGLVYFLSARAGRKRAVVSLSLFVLCAAFGYSDRFAFWDKNLVYEGESIYNYLQVQDLPDREILSTNVMFGVQSVKMKSEELTGMYYDYALAAPVMARVAGAEKPRILILGNGTGTYASQCEKYFPNASIDGVEIDEKITDLAYKYFNLPDSVNVCTYDGRAYLAASRDQYDVILVDAYHDITIPFQMSSVEFFTLVRDHLTENGVMVVNMNMTADAENGIDSALSDTISRVFDTVLTADIPGNSNRELFAANGIDLKKTLQEETASLRQTDLRALMTKVSAGLRAYNPGKQVMTDDRAPVEVLGARTLDAYIGQELQYYKDVFRRDGFSGLLNSF